jgi:hypothetical protein
LFDFAGVLTKTAKVHAAAWKEMFDAYPREQAARTGERFRLNEPASRRNADVATPCLLTKAMAMLAKMRLVSRGGRHGRPGRPG